MKIDAEKLIQDADIVQLVDRYVPLKKKGAEYYGICPFHDDDKSSLQVNSKKKIYKCFACGAGGDAIDFLQRMGRTFHEACEELNGGVMPEGATPEQREASKKKASVPNSWRHVNPAPEPAANITHYKHGKPSRSWVYNNAETRVVGYVCRFDMPDGSKEVLPYVYATDGNRSEWRWMGFEKPRSLYNLNKLTVYKDATVIVVEGEKTADAVEAELDHHKTVVVTWVGGAKGIEHTDWTPLHGRKVIFWPDNDTDQKYGNTHPKAGETKPWYEQPGNEAMLQIYHMNSVHLDVSKWVKVPSGYPHKWDAADKQWTPNELRTFVLQNIIDVPLVVSRPSEPQPEPKPEPKQKQKAEGPKNPPLPPNPVPPKQDKAVPDFAVNEHFRMLGYDKDENSRLAYYFFSFDAKAVIKLSPSNMSKSNLMMLAPINWWEDSFPGGKSSKVDTDAATQFLLTHSHAVGIFKDSFIRGRGAWVDGNRFIIHTGDILLVDGEPTPLKGFRSRYVYEIGERLGFGTSQQLPSAEASKLVEKMKWLMWEREINSYLLAGWCVIAPFCGILAWRPHIWVTGPAGSGKSWTMENILKRLVGETAIVVQGKTTEAGVRGMLQNDARPVLFDESDVDSNNDKERVQAVLALARSSSYRDGGLIGKGTQTGTSRTYTMRSCFAFSSIGVHLNQQSDRSRFTMLGLVSFDGSRTEEDFANFAMEWNSLVNDEFVHGLQSRTMALLPVILKNSKMFADAVAAVIGQRRIGDQVGGMLAGAYSLFSHKEVTYDEAVEWVRKRDWADEKALEATKDEQRLFGRIMSYMVRTESEYGTVERTIGELILVAANLRTELGITSERAGNRLRRIGILVKEKRIYIASNSDGITSIIKDTPWTNNYNKILERISGAEKDDSRHYSAGIKQRGVSLPLGLVSSGSNDIPLEAKYQFPQGEDDGLPI